MRQIISNKFNIAHLQMMYQMDHFLKTAHRTGLSLLLPAKLTRHASNGRISPLSV